jgi:hypothetical protein
VLSEKGLKLLKILNNEDESENKPKKNQRKNQRKNN